ncbi:MAG: dephospho-CoA kinase [Proteobacteria bacterium]|nr:MAG: dephospho-CoA kinase [Pseudomonadota bacterium]
MDFIYAFALSGGIATGKSTVADKLKSLGFDLIDLDLIAHELLDLHAESIGVIFGKEFIKKQRVDRKALGLLVFSNKKARKKLENFLHPLIKQEAIKLSRKFEEKKEPYFIDIPLFFEGRSYDIKHSILVYAPKNLQLLRLMKRSHLSKKEALARIEAQMNIEKKKKMANFIIDNSKDLKHLEKEIKRLQIWIKDINESIKI